MKSNIKQLIEQVVTDNREHIIRYSNNPYEYLHFDFAQEDQAHAWYLTDEEITEYENGDEAVRECFNNEITDLLKEYDYKLVTKRVFQKLHDDEDIYIFDDEQIEIKDWSEVYGNYGQKQFDEEQGLDVELIEYHDGHNYQSLVIWDNTYPHPALRELDPQESRDILAELEFAAWGQPNQGITEGKTETYTFSTSAWQGSYPGVRCCESVEA